MKAFKRFVFLTGMTPSESVIYLLAVFVICILLAGSAHCQSTVVTPHPVEHDPGAWAFTTGSVTILAGSFTRPWVGFAAGSAVGILSNMQASNNARQNIVGSIAGSAVGYVITKTIRKDWRHKR